MSPFKLFQKFYSICVHLVISIISKIVTTVVRKKMAPVQKNEPRQFIKYISKF